ncbi:MAG: hypothetical protein NXY57DRAFT_894410, partial [Lentinula lateritia]
STRNTRIERLWVEVGAQFARRWRAFFQRLEDIHGLDIHNQTHLWLLHELFLDEINKDCEQFCSDWNSHPVSGVGHDQSPEDMRLLGRIEHGEYKDDCEGLDPSLIEKYYGVNDEDDEDSDNDSQKSISDSDPRLRMIDHVTADVLSQLHHRPVPVPKHQNPFDPELHGIFLECLEECIRDDIIPFGHRVRMEEWDDEGYPSFEILKSGRRGTKELRIPLPVDDWLPRAELWVQARVAMDNILNVIEE